SRIRVAMPAERAYVPAMPPAAPLTAEELLALPIPDKRVELVRGVLIVREPAGYAHGRVAMNLAVQLATHVESAAAGQVFAVETAEGPLDGEDGLPGFICSLVSIL